MLDQERQQRDRVVAVAHTYLRTPYVDCARVKGHGADCATLFAMIYEEAGMIDHVDIPHYSPQWYLHRSEELFLEILRRYMAEIEEAAAVAGDSVIYKFGRCFSHGGVLIEPGWPAIIHAHKNSGCVVLGEGLGGELASRDRKFFRPFAWSR